MIDLQIEYLSSDVMEACKREIKAHWSSLRWIFLCGQKNKAHINAIVKYEILKHDIQLVLATQQIPPGFVDSVSQRFYQIKRESPWVKL